MPNCVKNCGECGRCVGAHAQIVIDEKDIEIGRLRRDLEIANLQVEQLQIQYRNIVTERTLLEDALACAKQKAGEAIHANYLANRLVGEMKAMLWVARDAVTDHDFEKGHRYDVLADEIEKVVGPGDRCRHCGALASRETTHVCALKQKCLGGEPGHCECAECELERSKKRVDDECQHSPCTCSYCAKDPLCVKCDRIIGRVK